VRSPRKAENSDLDREEKPPLPRPWSAPNGPAPPSEVAVSDIVLAVDDKPPVKGSKSLELCCLHVVFSYPAKFIDFCFGAIGRLCLKMTVTLMGYLPANYIDSVSWIKKNMHDDALVKLQNDEMLNSFMTHCCVIAGLAAAIFSDHIETKMNFFAFLIAYSTAKVCLEPISAAITSSWIASLNGDTRGSQFDRLLHESNKAIRRMIKQKDVFRTHRDSNR